MHSLRNLIYKTISDVSTKRYVHTTKVLTTFWESDEKGGYKDNRKQPKTSELIRDGFKELKEEISLWSKEVKERFDSDPMLIFRPGEIDVMWKFNENNIKSWNVTSDKTNNEGYSECSFDLNEFGNAVFKGNLDTRVPKTGTIKRAGYCNVKSTRARKSFKRETYLDWTSYNMLVLRVRGDGRSYLINIGTKGYYDILWNDVYHYALYTRGGPYWQETKIPFSKFFLSSKGRVQDKQYPLPLNRVTDFGISLGDKVDGPFSLEIDYIGLEFDPTHTEEFAYEMYKTDKYIVAT